MVNIRVSFILISFYLFFQTPYVRAQCDSSTCDQDVSKCESSSSAAVGQAQSAVNAAKAAEGNIASSGAAASGTNINSNSGIDSNSCNQQSSNLGGAIGKTNAAKSQCVSSCESAKSDAQSMAQQYQSIASSLPPQDPNKQICQTASQKCQSDSSKIEGIQKSQCEQPIDSKTNELQAGKDAMPSCQQQAKNTGSSSGMGGMPSMPQMGGGGNKGDGNQSPQQSPNSSTPTTPTATNSSNPNCSGPTAARLSDCNNQFVTNCTSDPTGPGCASFTSRYCTPSSTANSNASQTFMSSVPSTNMVVDKAGEGIGTPYCQAANSSQFCQTPGHAQCPSCSGSPSSVTADQLNQAKITCPDDPLFLNPSNFASNSNSSGSKPAGSAALSVSGSGGGLSQRAAAQGEATEKQARAGMEGYPAGLNMDVGGGSGGSYGGGSSYGEGREPSSYSSHLKDLFNSKDGKARKSVDALVGGAPVRDVASAAGPSLFTLSSIAYQAYCTRVQAKNCR